MVVFGVVAVAAGGRADQEAAEPGGHVTRAGSADLVDKSNDDLFARVHIDIVVAKRAVADVTDGTGGRNGDRAHHSRRRSHRTDGRL